MVDKAQGLFKVVKVPFLARFVVGLFANRLKKALWIQGMGRHTHTEIEHMGRQDIAALSAYLGELKGKSTQL